MYRTVETSMARDLSVVHSPSDVRVSFIKKTYAHLAGAILLFVGVEYALLHSPLASWLISHMTGGQISWLIVLALFMGVSWIADRWARSATSTAMQYAGLGLYVVAEAIVFVPLLYFASMYAPRVIPMAGIMTILLTIGLTGTVLITGKDFSFLQPLLTIGGLLALGIIGLAALTGLTLGLIFSAAMTLFAGAAIIYSTSNVLHHYTEGQHVAASLSLFASIALLFWYVINILLAIVDR